MRHLVICIILLCGAMLLSAQTPQWQWAVRAGGSGNDQVLAMASDGLGNQYLTGSFSGTADFGPISLTSSVLRDIYIAKLDDSGDWLWAVRAGGISNDTGNGIAVDSAGNALITGSFQLSADFGPYTLTATGYNDIFAAKLDSMGNWLWAHQAGGTNFESGNSIAVDGAGNSYLTGYFSGSASFGPHTLISTGGSDDIFVAKIDPTGNWLWAVRAGGNETDEGLDITVDGAGNVFLTGAFQDNAAFGPYNLNSSGYTDIFAAKLDPNGNWLWAVRAGGTSVDIGYGLALDGLDNAYLTGCFQGSAAFGAHNVTATGELDIFVAKLDSNGAWLWVDQAGGISDDYGYGIAVDSPAGAFLTGSFMDSADFGADTLTSGGYTDIFIAKLASNGEWLWADRAGGTDEDIGYGIAMGTESSVWLSGVFQQTASFGPFTLTSNGSKDIFVAKLTSEVGIHDEPAPEPANTSSLADAFPNPLCNGSSTLIRACIGERESGILRLFNLRGQCVESWQLNSGVHQISVQASDLPAGIYLYQLSAPSVTIVKKLVLLK